jgi:hypothetical protein
MKPSRTQVQREIFKWVPLTFVMLVVLAGYTSVSWATYTIPSDRSIDWSKAGVAGGIPARTTIYTTLPSGSTAAQIQTAINNCPTGQVVQLGTGTFNLGTTQITMKSGVTLRGNGPANTKVYSTATGGNLDGIIRLYGGYNFFTCPSSSQYKAVSGNIAKGATTITLPNVTNLSVGNVVSVSQTNNTSYVEPVGSGQGCSYCGICDGQRLQQQLTKITAINGNVITVDPPIALDYTSVYTPWVSTSIGALTTNAGVEDLYLENTNATPYYALFAMNFTDGCWLKNVEGKGFMNRAVVMVAGFRNTIRDSYFHDSYGKGGTGSDTDNGSDHGYGIGVQNWSSYNLIENNRFDRMHVAVAMDGGPGAGNVVGYNVVTNQKYKDNTFMQHDFLVHSSFPHMTLFEGNMGYGGINDNIHAGNGYTVWFRNWLRNTNGTELSSFRGTSVTGFLYSTNTDRGSYYVSWVGNVLGYSGMGGVYEYINRGVTSSTSPIVKNNPDSSNSTKTIFRTAYIGSVDTSGYDSLVWSTLLRHQNFNYSNNSTYACNSTYEPGCQGGNADTVLPASLYLKSKPAFLGSSPWPVIGPDVSPMYPPVPAAGVSPWGNATAAPTPPPPTLKPAQ